MSPRDTPIARRLCIPRSRPDAGWRGNARHLALLLLSGFVLSAYPTAPANALASAEYQSRRADPYAAHVTDASQRFGIPAAWIRAVMRKESAGDVRAVSIAGARGLMQIMPATWDDLRARLALGRDPFDPRDNILAGTAYLRELHDRYGSPGFLAAYNAGPARYEAYLAGRPLPAETRAYVAALAPLVGGTLTDPAPMSTAAIAAETLPWRRSPLFVQVPVHIATVALDGANSATAANAIVRDVSAVTPRSNGLFPVRFDAGGPK